jgi:V/A-type H+/Na+-transporting ATPase subunit I
MPWLEAAFPVRMTRIALVAPAASVRSMLVAVADAGVVEIDAWTGPDGIGPDGAEALVGEQGDAIRRKAGQNEAGTRRRPALAAELPSGPDALERAGRPDLVAGEAQLRRYADAAVSANSAVALAGWTPSDQVDDLAARLASIGCAAVPLARPGYADAPTLVAGSAGQRALTPLVSTYGTVPYADINPAWLAWGSYVLMFGMMFGDAGDGLLLIAAAVALRSGWPGWVRRYRAAWPFVAGAGVAATAFGIAYGEFFGPTGAVPALWLNPLDHPVPLLLAGIGIGALLLAGAYTLGAINRWREGGWPLALYAPSGIAGAAVFCAIGVLTVGWYFHTGAALVAGGALAAAALAVAFAGFLTEAGGGGIGMTQASVEVFDLVIRLGSNVVSFARLAAFGLAHAALSLLVWDGTTALARRGGLAILAAIVLFAAGSALAFGLEALVAAVQALRLEYYELFSRVFVGQGRPFRPWHLPIDTGQERSVATGGHPVGPVLTGAPALGSGEA